MATVDVDDLDYPATSWYGFFKNHFGPSMLWALIGIGGSHVVLGPTMGAAFGLFAVWVFAVIYAAKYGAWELGIRYNYGVGGNPVAAYDQLPGPKNWMQWYTVAVFTIAYTFIAGGVGLSTASLVAPFVPLDVPQVFVLLILIAGVLVYFTRYRLLEKILLGFVVVLGILLVLGALVGPPAADEAIQTAFSIDLSGNRLVLFVALFAAAAGFAPTGFSTSVLLGSWSMAKGEGARKLAENGMDPEDERYHDYIREWIRIGRRDFNIGYAFSFVLMTSMIVLASSVLYPVTIDDQNFAFLVAQLLSQSFGEWAQWAMLLGTFAALYSTLITIIDGASRATADIVPLVVDSRPIDGEQVRRAVIVLYVGFGSALVLLLGNVPVTFLVTIAAILAVTDVLFYPANWYVVRNNLPEPFQPSRSWITYYVTSFALVLLFGFLGALSELGLISSFVELLPPVFG